MSQTLPHVGSLGGMVNEPVFKGARIGGGFTGLE